MQVPREDAWGTADVRKPGSLLLARVAAGIAFGTPSLLTAGAWFNQFRAQNTVYQHDAVAFWAAAKHLAGGGGLSEIYSFPRFHAIEQALLPGWTAQLPYPYPPPGMLLFLPMGWWGFVPAVIGWAVVGFLALLGAGWVLAGRQRRWLAPALCLSPVAFVNAAFEQTGAVIAAAAAAGLMLAARWPFLGGGLIGLMIIKPQFALLPGVALLASRNWRAVAAAMTTVAALVLVTAAQWGWSSWAAWLVQLAELGKALLVSASTRKFGVTPFLALHDLGAPDAVAGTVQAMVTLALAALVAVAVRRRGLDQASVALALAGVTLASPYAMTYDLTFTAAALTAALADSGVFVLRAGEPTAFLAAWIAPLVAVFEMSGKWSETWVAPGIVVVGLMLVMILTRRAFAASASQP